MVFRCALSIFVLCIYRFTVPESNVSRNLIPSLLAMDPVTHPHLPHHDPLNSTSGPSQIPTLPHSVMHATHHHTQSSTPAASAHCTFGSTSNTPDPRGRNPPMPAILSAAQRQAYPIVPRSAAEIRQTKASLVKMAFNRRYIAERQYQVFVFLGFQDFQVSWLFFTTNK